MLEASPWFMLADSTSKQLLATVALCKQRGERHCDEAVKNI